jgi:deazaflavin-dependent oxidoreductase (nitroreductase family)
LEEIMSEPDRGPDFNQRVVEEFRANGGRVGGELAGTDIILVHHTGARSGIARITPLAYARQDESRYVIIGSNGGSPITPQWVYNLRAHPDTTVEVGTETFPVVAEELAGAAREETWQWLVGQWPSVREFQAAAPRRFPLFALTRRA